MEFPVSLLKKGKNEIMIFETVGRVTEYIKLVNAPHLIPHIHR